MVTTDKRELILQAAVQVFAKEGVERGKIADIAKEAGIGKGTVYEYFRSKEEILRGIEADFLQQSQAQFDALMERDLSPSQKLEELFTLSIAMTDQLGDAVPFLIEVWAHAARWQLKSSYPNFLQEVSAYYRREITKVLKEGVKAGEFREMNYDGVATLLLATLDGMGMQYMVMKGSEQFGKAQKEAVKSFMRGIRK